jgi:ribosomal protein S15P/S13E
MWRSLGYEEEEEDLQAVRAHNHLVEKREELVHYIREKERQESQECVCCVCV